MAFFDTSYEVTQTEYNIIIGSMVVIASIITILILYYVVNVYETIQLHKKYKTPLLHVSQYEQRKQKQEERRKSLREQGIGKAKEIEEEEEKYPPPELGMMDIAHEYLNKQASKILQHGMSTSSAMVNSLLVNRHGTIKPNVKKELEKNIGNSILRDVTKPKEKKSMGKKLLQGIEQITKNVMKNVNKVKKNERDFSTIQGYSEEPHEFSVSLGLGKTEPITIDVEEDRDPTSSMFQYNTNLRFSGKELYDLASKVRDKIVVDEPIMKNVIIEEEPSRSRSKSIHVSPSSSSSRVSTPMIVKRSSLSGSSVKRREQTESGSTGLKVKESLLESDSD